MHDRFGLNWQYILNTLCTLKTFTETNKQTNKIFIKHTILFELGPFFLTSKFHLETNNNKNHTFNCFQNHIEKELKKKTVSAIETHIGGSPWINLITNKNKTSKHQTKKKKEKKNGKKCNKKKFGKIFSF